MIEILILLVFLVIQFFTLIHQGTLQREMIQSFLDYQTEMQFQLEALISDVKNR